MKREPIQYVSMDMTLRQAIAAREGIKELLRGEGLSSRSRDAVLLLTLKLAGAIAVGEDRFAEAQRWLAKQQETPND